MPKVRVKSYMRKKKGSRKKVRVKGYIKMMPYM